MATLSGSTRSSVQEAPGSDRLEEFARAVEVANIPTLLMMLVQLTGDMKWLEDPYRPVKGPGLSDNDSAGLSPELQAEIRAASLEAIEEWLGGRSVAIESPSPDLLVQMLSIAMDETVPPEFGPMMLEDMTRAGVASDGSSAISDEVELGHRSAVIIGAGISGVCAAMEFDRAGLPYVVLERGNTVGGTWRTNGYPGAGVDTPSHLYSFSTIFHDWERFFALQYDLHAYLQKVSADAGVDRNIRFGHTVTSARFDDATQKWTVSAVDEAGVAHEFVADFVVSAVGVFSAPKWPDIPGLETFKGTTVHAAAWSAPDLQGKRVAVIGAGATSMQLVPAITDEVGSLVVFQRSPQWAAPFEKFRKVVPNPVRFLIRNQPHYAWWYRARLHWVFNDRLFDSLQKDPSWPTPETSLNSINEGHRRYFTRYLLKELEGRDDLIEKSLPNYPPYGKRMLLDNGWYRAIRKDHVELVTDGINRITESSIVTSAGDEFEVDVIIMATGFDVLRFLGSYSVTGRAGKDIHETWDGDDPRAYLGVAVPGFPNFFIMYGPNVQPGHGGSYIWTAEAQALYMVRLMKDMERDGIASIEVRQDVYDHYNAKIDAAHENMIWTHRGMTTYYRNSRGRVVVPIPFRNIDYWEMSRASGLTDYETRKRDGDNRAT